MLKKLLLTIFLCAFAMLAQANAQTAASTEKQAAIKELLALIDSENKASDFLPVLFEQMEKSRQETLQHLLSERSDLSADDKKALENLLLKDQKYSFKNFQQRLLQKIDFDAVMNEISTAIYDKHYTLEEIKDLTAFYRTPTGQKSLKLLTAIYGESVTATSEKLLPKVLEVLDEIQNEERREIEQKIEAKKPRAKKPNA